MNKHYKLNCIERFELAVQKFKECPCIEEGDRKVSYWEFYKLVKQAANYIASESAKRIVIDMRQGIDAYAVIIGALSVGSAWCPIPASIPVARREDIIAEFQPDLVMQELKEKRRDHNILPANLPASAPAYVLFTSGTTGRPKGVVVGRATIDTFLEWSLATYNTAPGDRWGQFCRLNFDLSVIDIFTAICSGACLVVLDDMLSQVRPLDAINERRLSVWHSVPGIVDFMIKNNDSHPGAIPSLKIASFCGEPLKKHQLDFLFEKNKELRVINSYGTTEGGLNASWIEVNSANYKDFTENHLSIGHAIPGWGVQLEADGEIVIYGDNIGLGYLNAADDRFRMISIGKRSYRAFFTGDLAYENDGVLYITGRKDDQVKILGNRIELGEIEFWITELCGKPCATILLNNALYSFVESEHNLDTAWLRQKLMERLEKVKIPDLIIPVAAFPRNSNFKTVRRELAALIPGACFKNNTLRSAHANINVCN